MTDLVTAKTLRQWAEQCALQATKARNDVECRRLLKMEAALRELAQTQECLDGFPKGNVEMPSTLAH